MKKAAASLWTRWLSVLPRERDRVAKLGAVVESLFCIGCSLLAFGVIGCVPVTSVSVVVSLVVALIGFVGSVGIAIESGIGHWRKLTPRWRYQLAASFVGLVLAAIAVYFSVDHLLEMLSR